MKINEELQSYIKRNKYNLACVVNEDSVIVEKNNRYWTLHADYIYRLSEDESHFIKSGVVNIRRRILSKELNPNSPIFKQLQDYKFRKDLKDSIK